MELMLPSFYSWTKRGLGAALFLTRVDRYAKNSCRANKSSPKIVILSLCLEKAESSKSPVKSYEASVIASSSPLIHKEALPPLFFCFRCKNSQQLAASSKDVRLPLNSIYISKIRLKFSTFFASKVSNMEPNQRCAVCRPNCEQDWEPRKAPILELHGCMGLVGLMKVMEEKHLFKATYVSVLSLLGTHILRYQG